MWKSLFTFNRSERRGSWLLYVLVAGMLFLNTFYPFVFRRSPEIRLPHPDIESFRFILTEKETQLDKPKYDRPSYKNKPAHSKSYPASKSKQKPAFHPNEKLELNRIDSASLVAVPGIGKVLSARILRYRQLLGGFYQPRQLIEVYGIRQEWLNEMEIHFVADTSLISPLAIDTASFKKILSHPYFDYEMTRKLFAMRKRPRELSAMQIPEVLEQIACPDSLKDKLRPYIVFSHPEPAQD